jgi:cell division protein FtsN
MAKRKKRRSSRSTRAKKNQDFPGWLWMLFGLAIGLSVAFAVHMRDSQPGVGAGANKSAPAPVAAVIDDNGEASASAAEAPPAEERRFTFYELLPNFVVEIPEQEPEIAADIKPQAVVEPGVYVLQAGSFSTEKDADRRRAELGMHGIESKIQRVKINDKNYYRVYVGPTDNLDQLNMLRSRLRVAKIDVFRIKLSD